MEATAHAADSADRQFAIRCLRRKYVIPFLLTCLILCCNTATGVNSIIGYNTGILLQSGLSDLQAHWGYVIFTTINFLMTIVGLTLVDRKGRKFLFVIGTSGIILSMATVGVLFLKTERQSVDCHASLASRCGARSDSVVALRPTGGGATAGRASKAQLIRQRASLTVIYSYGDYTATTSFVRSDDPSAAPIQITRASCVPANKVQSFFKNPFANLDAARTAPLVIRKALIGQVPNAGHGWLVALASISSSRSTPWGRASASGSRSQS